MAAILTFAIANLPITALNATISIYLPRHFASQIGISLAAVGSAFAIVRLIDIAVDLALGLIMDRTRTPWGRYRVWLVIGVPIFVLAVHQLFMAPAGVGVGYLIIWLLVLYLGLSILVLAHNAWATTLSSSYDERTRIFGVMAALGVLGSICMYMTPVALAAMGRPDGQGVPVMGWMLMIAAPIAIAITVLRTPERLRLEVPGQRFRMRDYWELVRHPSMGRVIIADFGLALGPGWLSATVLYLLTVALGFTAGQANLLLAISISAGFLGAPFVVRLANRISKHRALMVIATCYAVTVGLMPFCPKGSMPVMIALIFSMGFFNGGITAMVRAMTADVSDEIRLEQGKERAGLLFAITTLTSKVAMAFSIFLVFNILAKVGFDPKAQSANTPEAIRGLVLASTLGAIFFVTAGAYCLIGYRLNAKRHDEIRAELEARDAKILEENDVPRGLSDGPPKPDAGV